MGSEETAPNSLENLNGYQEEIPEKQVLATAREQDVSSHLERCPEGNAVWKQLFMQCAANGTGHFSSVAQLAF